MNTTEVKVPNNEANWQSIEIFLFSNGQQYSPPRKYHLQAEELNWWDATLNHLAHLQYGTQHPLINLYTTDGRLVEGPLELRDGMAYVAVKPPEQFIDAGYEKYLIKATRSWEKRQARKNNPACDHEQPCCRCPVKEACKLYESCCLCSEKEEAAIADNEEYKPPGGHFVNPVLAKSGAAETLTEYEPRPAEYEPRTAEYDPRPAENGSRLNENGTKSSEHGTKLIERGDKLGAHEAYSGESDVDTDENAAHPGEQRSGHGKYLASPIKRGPQSDENRAIPIEYGAEPVREETDRNEPWLSVPEPRTDEMGREVENDSEDTGDNDSAITFNESRAREDELAPQKDGYRLGENENKSDQIKPWVDEYGYSVGAREPKSSYHESRSGDRGKVMHESSPRSEERSNGSGKSGAITGGNGTRLGENRSKSNNHGIRPENNGTKVDVSGGKHSGREGEHELIGGHIGNENDHRARSGDIGRRSGDHESKTAEQWGGEIDHGAAVGERGVKAGEQISRETGQAARARNLSGRAGDLAGNGVQHGVRAADQGGRGPGHGPRNGDQHGIRAAEQRDRSKQIDDLGGRVGDLAGNRAERGVRAIEQRNRATELTKGDHGSRTGDHRARVGEHGSRANDRERRTGELEVREGDIGGRTGDHAARLSEPSARGGEHIGRAGDIDGRVGNNRGKAGDRVARLNGSRSRAAENGARVNSGGRSVEPGVRASPGARGAEARFIVSSGGRNGEPGARVSSGGRSGDPRRRLSSGGRSGEPEARLSFGGRGGEPGIRLSSGARPGVPGAILGRPINSVGGPEPRSAGTDSGVGNPGLRGDNGGVNGAAGFPYIFEAQQHVRRSNLSTGKPSTEKKRCSAGQASLTGRQTPNLPLCAPPKKFEDKKPNKSNRESTEFKLATNVAGKAPARSPNGSEPSNEVKTLKIVPKYPHKRFAPTAVPPPTGNYNQIIIKRKSNSLTKITSNHKALAADSSPIGNVFGDKEIIVVSASLYRNQVSEITSLGLDADRRHIMNGIRDSSDETQTAQISVQQSILSIPINEEMQACVEQEFTEVVDKHGEAITTNSKIKLTRTESGLRDNMVATDIPEKNYISIINKGDVVNLKLNIELWNGDRSGNFCQKNGRRSRSLTNDTRTEKGSQISFDDVMYVQSKSLQSLLNNECFRGCGFEGRPKVVIVQCACCAHGLKNPPRCDTTSCNDNKKYVVLVPNSKQEHSEDKCYCEPTCHSDEQKLHPQLKKHGIYVPVKKTVSNMSLEIMTVRESNGCERRDIHIATTNSTVQTDDQKSEISTIKRVSITEDSNIRCAYKTSLPQISVSQTQFLVTKNNNCLETPQEMCSQAVSQADPQISQLQTQTSQAQTQGCPQTCPQSQSQGCPQTCMQAQLQVCAQTCPQAQSQVYPQAQSQVGSQVCMCSTTTTTQIRAQVCDSQTQTDWCSILLEARRHEDGRYSFHLPPLHVLRYYTF